MTLSIVLRSRVFVWLLISMGLCNLQAISSTASENQSLRKSQDLAQDDQPAPDFQKHVVPLLGRLGCNGRACHGAFGGRGEFALSLFGYDFVADHAALTNEDYARIDAEDVSESMILAKPSGQMDHEGGIRFEAESWEYKLLRRWVAAGADGGDIVRDQTAAKNGNQTPRSRDQLLELTIEPARIILDSKNQPVPLQVVAHWESGWTEDVTALCRYKSRDESIATVNLDGMIQPVVSKMDPSLGPIAGDTHIVISYDNAVQCVPVVRPVGDYDKLDPSTYDVVNDRSHPIDRLIGNRLDELGIVSSPICNDADFIRRASVDITGWIPKAEVVSKFLSNDDPDKRQKLVRSLLASPQYATWWATRFGDWTGNNPEQLRNVLPAPNVAPTFWHRWMEKRLGENMPYDQIIEGVVVAQSRQPGEDYRTYCENLSQICSEADADGYAERDGMPLYWARREFQSPQERAIGFAYSFLGVRIECAQCHKHPFDRWTKNDFDEFAKLFSPIRANQNTIAPDSREAREALLEEITGDKKLRGGELRRAVTRSIRQGKTVPQPEIFVSLRKENASQRKKRERLRKMGKKVPNPRVPTGQILGDEDRLQLNTDPRDGLMEWLRDSDNPYFARAIVNRVWAHYFGMGIVDPTDDMNLGNPPSNPELLDHLAKEFVAHRYDLKWLHAYIVSSQAYARSTMVNATNRHDRKHFSHHVPHRLPAEAVVDAIALVTRNDAGVDKFRNDPHQAAIGDKRTRRGPGNYALGVLGQSTRASNCDCDRDNSPTVLQAIFLHNDNDVHSSITAANGWVNQCCKALEQPLAKPIAGGSNSKAQKAKKMAIEKMVRKHHQRAVEFVQKYRNATPEMKKKFHPRLVATLKKMRTQAAKWDSVIPATNKLIHNDEVWESWSKSETSDLIAQRPAVTTEVSTEQLASVVEQGYLRCLSRYPTDNERQIATDFLHQSESFADGLEALTWTLLNTKEFLVSH